MRMMQMEREMEVKAGTFTIHEICVNHFLYIGLYARLWNKEVFVAWSSTGHLCRGADNETHSYTHKYYQRDLCKCL